MRVAFLNILVGFICLFTCMGIGCLVLRRLRIDVSGHWKLALSTLCGVTVSQSAITLLLYLGGGVRSLRVISILLLGTGAYGLLHAGRMLPTMRRSWLAVFVLTALGLNLLIAVAPSSKIDELHYHMLTPKRIVEDDGLRAYREPFEAAIFPQMGFQYALSVVHALGFPEAGNVISWGLSAVLMLFLAGVVGELTGSGDLGWIASGAAAVGVYTSVFHVTSGAHALGDLAIVVALCLCVLPNNDLTASQRLVLICAALATAASTKVSLLPVCLLITIAAMRRLPLRTSILLAGSVWGVLYGPGLLWSYLQTGSPFGLVAARLFSSDFFDASSLAKLADARVKTQVGLLGALWQFGPSASLAIPLALCVIAFRKQWPFRFVFSLIAIQLALIAFLLPHDFRFLGGLQFVVLIMAAWSLSEVQWGHRILVHSGKFATVLCLPWLVVQAYYSRPFIAVDAGLMDRESFLERYVSFAADFRMLDSVLPQDAVLYIAGTIRPALYYSPRPVILSPRDAPQDRPIYRFATDAKDDPRIGCNEVIYANPQAITAAFRTRREPERGNLRVERCYVKNDGDFLTSRSTFK